MAERGAHGMSAIEGLAAARHELARRRRRERRWAAAVLAATALLAPIGCAPGAETLASLQLTLAGPVAPHGPATLTITAVGDRGTAPLTSFGGTVALAVSEGSLDRTSVALASGSGEVDVTFTGLVAPVTLTATVGAIETSVVVDLQPLASVPGDPAAPFARALPYLAYRARPGDVSTGAADLPGVPLSHTTALAVVDPSATVGAFNALLARHGAALAGMVPDASGSVGAIVAIRLPTADHAAMTVALAALAAEPLLSSVQRDMAQSLPDVDGGAVASLAVPRPTNGTPSGWTWERNDAAQPVDDANWGLEAIRVPQAWNLNGAARARLGAAGTIATGVLDTGFDVAHPDLVLDLVPLPANPGPEPDHGTHVAGTIGARFDDGVGIDGVNPFAGLVARVFDAGSSTWGMIDFILKRPGLRVVNASLCHNWYKYPTPIDPGSDANAQQQVTQQGALFAAFLAGMAASGTPVPVIVASACNDSGQAALGGVDVEAKWASPFTSAALTHGAPGILVVEAVGRTFGDQLARAPFSNLGGHVAAPGVGIVSTMSTQPYGPLDGTSMAAPHVTGLVGLLFAMADAGASTATILDAVRSTAAPAVSPDTAPVVDAWAAMVALDAALGAPRTLRLLADVDDGTADGNLRMVPGTNEPVLADSGDAFGPRGDGTIDMRDFRRFRDALLLTEGVFDLALDGAPDHPKKDLNLDGQPGDGVAENVFPRFDLNGDGKVDRTAIAPVGGLLQNVVTDLDVLRFVWDDPLVPEADLPDLLDSGDLHVRADGAFDDPETAAVEIDLPTPTPRVLRIEATDPDPVVTVPVGVHDLVVRYLDAADAELARCPVQAVVGLGADVPVTILAYRPDGILVAPTSTTLAPGATQAFVAVVDGPCRDVIWSADGGVISEEGEYTAGDVAGTYQVRAESVVDRSVAATATVTIDAPSILGTYVGTSVEYDYGECVGCSVDPARIVIALEPGDQLTLAFCRTGSAAAGWCTTRPEGWDMKYDVTVVGDVITGTGVRWDGAYAGSLEVDALLEGGTLTGTASWQSGCPGGCFELFEVVQEP